MNGVISTAGVFQYKRLYLHKCYIYIYYYIFIFLAVFTGQNNTPFLIPPKKNAMILSHLSHLESVGGFMGPPKEINAFLNFWICRLPVKPRWSRLDINFQRCLEASRRGPPGAFSLTCRVSVNENEVKKYGDITGEASLTPESGSWNTHIETCWNTLLGLYAIFNGYFIVHAIIHIIYWIFTFGAP